MYNLIDCSDAYLKTSGSSWQYYRDEPALNNNGNIVDFSSHYNDSISFKLKQQITGQTGDNGEKVEIMVPFKYLSSFLRTLEMPSVNCEISFMLTWSENCFLVAVTAANQEPTFTITDTKLYVHVATLSTQDNIKLLKQLESGYQGAINWNKYQFEVTEQAQNRYLDFLIDPSFQGVNRPFILSFGTRRVPDSYWQNFLPNVEIKDCNVVIYGRNFFDKPVKMI